ncbi:hypothetical protein [Murimonas intestini]|uniref:hypothetical protein n=1 Tax=Murimonas intestini TaxID=1337051 RepID=UPI001651ED1D|nr:hypothetical protein [Murimonas intestini]
MIRKKDRLITFGTAAVMSIGDILFAIVLLSDLFLFRNKVLRQAVLSPSSLVIILSEITCVSIAAVLSNNS